MWGGERYEEGRDGLGINLNVVCGVERYKEGIDGLGFDLDVVHRATRDIEKGELGFTLDVCGMMTETEREEMN